MDIVMSWHLSTDRWTHRGVACDNRDILIIVYLVVDLYRTGSWCTGIIVYLYWVVVDCDCNVLVSYCTGL